MTSPQITPNNISQYNYSDAIDRRYWDQKFSHVTFQTNPVSAAVAGGAASGSANATNVFSTDQNASFEYFVIVGQTILAPTITSTGLNIALDQVSTHGVEYSRGITANCPDAFTVGTSDPFYVQTRISAATAAGCNPLILGFRKVAAANATLSSYTDFASIGMVGTASPNTIKTETQVASGGVVTTDTTNTWSDGATHTLRVSVDGSGNVTYAIDGVSPTVTVAYQFTAGTVVVPFLRVVQAAGLSGAVNWQEYECGYQITG